MDRCEVVFDRLFAGWSVGVLREDFDCMVEGGGGEEVGEVGMGERMPWGNLQNPLPPVGPAEGKRSPLHVSMVSRVAEEAVLQAAVWKKGEKWWDY